MTRRGSVFKLTPYERAIFELWEEFSALGGARFCRELGIDARTLHPVIQKARILKQIEADEIHFGKSSLKRARGRICLDRSPSSKESR